MTELLLAAFIFNILMKLDHSRVLRAIAKNQVAQAKQFDFWQKKNREEIRLLAREEK